MLQVRAATEIHASPAAVWRVLTDLPRFRLWNPFIRAARGSTQKGGTVRVQVRPPLGVPLHFAARITEREDERELRWDGHVGAEWLARGDHVFTITRLADGWVRFNQIETFSGVLPWLLRRLLARQARRGFEAMNEALAREAEA
jgi:hypothetical protein